MTDPRLYFRLHDGYTDSPKIAHVGGDAGWLDICAMGYCSRNLSDGVVPKVLVPRLSDRSNPQALARALLDVGRWHEAPHDCPRCPQPGPDDYIIHDYLKHQRSAQEVADLRRKRSEAGAKGGKARANAQANAKQTLKQTPSKRSSKIQAETETETEKKTPPHPPAENSPERPPTPEDQNRGEGKVSQTKTLDDLTAELHRLRPEWLPEAIHRELTRAQQTRRSPDVIAEAARRCYTDPATNAPGRLIFDGPWWAAAGEEIRTAQRAAQAAAPRCPHHRGQPAHNCGNCRAEALADPVETPEDPGTHHALARGAGTCEHGFKIARRKDGKPTCAACRRLPSAVGDPTT